MKGSRFALVFLYCLVPALTGCAFGAGQIGPVGPVGQPEHRVGVLLGLGIRGVNEEFTGQRDSTWMRQLYPTAEIAYNLPGNLLGVGLAANRINSSEMDRDEGSTAGPKKVIWQGYAAGPAAWLRLSNWLNVEGKALRLHAHVDNEDAAYFSGADGDRYDVKGWCYEGDLNVNGNGSQGRFGVKLGWQVTMPDEMTMWGASRKYASNGPHIVWWHNF